MLIHEINNNILNYGVLFLGGYQDKYENWELYQDMDDFWGYNPQKISETVVHVTHSIINIWKNTPTNFKKGAGCSGIIVFNWSQKLTEKCAVQNGSFSPVFWRLLVTMLLLLFNYPSTTYRLGHHEVWIRASTLPQVSKKLLRHNFKTDFYPNILVPVTLPLSLPLCWLICFPTPGYGPDNTTSLSFLYHATVPPHSTANISVV